MASQFSLQVKRVLVWYVFWYAEKIKRPKALYRLLAGGGGEIRTHERLPVAGFQDRCNRPLCHTSKMSMRDCS